MSGQLPSLEIRRRLAMQVLLLLGVTVLIGGVASFIYALSLPYTGFEFGRALSIGEVFPGSPAESAGLRRVSAGGRSRRRQGDRDLGDNEGDGEAYPTARRPSP